MWWHDAVFYGVYLPGFHDSRGRGHGDFRGLTQELPYLQDLGVDALWLSPCYVSPMVDNGYDVEDYRRVNPLFGTEHDFDALMDKAARLGIKVVLDMVLNHSSTRHRWFQESRDPESPYRSWYLWRPLPANNWVSFFGGSAWQFDPQGQGCYLHSFAPEMADLNWDHPPLREEMLDTLDYWVQRGAAGYRLDVINFLKAGCCLNLDNPPGPLGQDHLHDVNAPGIPGVLRDIRDRLARHGDIFLLGEVGSDKIEVLGEEGRRLGLDAVFGFHISSLATPDLGGFARQLQTQEGALAPVAALSCLSTHDIRRFHTRLGGNDPDRSLVFLALLLTAPGIPLLFQGDELRLPDWEPRSMDEIIDTQAHQCMQDALARGESREEAERIGMAKCRDHSRALMFQSAPEGSGDPGPHLVARPSWDAMKIRCSQVRDPASPWAETRQLVALRQRHEALCRGNLEIVQADEDHLTFERRSGDERIRMSLGLKGPIPTDLLTLPPHRHLFRYQSPESKPGTPVYVFISLISP